MVAGARDDARPAPLIWASEPEVAAPKILPLPNVVAVGPPVKAAELPRVAALPEGPRVAAEVKTAVELPVAAPSGPRRAFTPPPNVRMQRQAMVQLPEGPQPEMVVEPDALPFPGAGPRPEPKAFVAPPTKSRPVTAAAA